MSFKGPIITKLNGGLRGQAKNTDAAFGLICGGVAAAGLALNTPLKLIQLSDAEDAGIDAAYDAANDVLVHYHIEEFFRLCPTGTLYIMLVAQATTLEDMCDIALANNIKDLVLASDDHEVKYVGAVLNPIVGYVSVIQDGLDADVVNAIPKAQALVDDLFVNHQIYLDGILLEGRELNGTIAALVDLHSYAKRNVSVVLAQDPAIVALSAEYSNTAAVGSALGGIAIRKVCENLGSLEITNMPLEKKADETYSLTDDALGRWEDAALSDGTLFSDLTPAERVLLLEKGYIYVGTYEGYPGYFFNQGHTAADLEDDFTRIERNRTWNKAARYVRRALLPKMNGNIDIDANTGFIKPSIVGDWEAIAQKRVDQMLTDDEVSAVKVKIDPFQNVFAADLNLTLTVVLKGVAEGITADIGFALKIN